MATAIEADAAATRRRQHAGVACDECRRRKLRCDGQQPQCSVCSESGLICEVSQRGTRGPKKGYITALKNKVVQLEAMLENQQSEQQQGGTVSSSDVTLPTPPVDLTEATEFVFSPSWLPAASTSVSATELLQPNNSQHESSSLSECPLASTLFTRAPSRFPQITGAVRAELDQLYFDRVHPSVPILHQRRYFSWSKSDTKTPSRICLQYAMWSVATLLSTQFRDLIDPLYRETKQILEALTVEGGEDIDCRIELVQSWLLVAMYESMRTYHRQAWLSAGRAFRIVQVLRYHEIDSPKSSKIDSMPGADAIETEEKRRVFWMAFFLDHLFAMRDDWPITLNEHVICTRLPSPDAEFQSGQPILGCFLSEAMTEPNLMVRSPFNECIILVTISGRSLLHSQKNNIFKAYGDTALNLGEQYQWLDNTLTTRLQILSNCYPSPTETYDPMLLFASILGQATVIYCCKGMMGLEARPVNSVESGTEALDCQQRALTAIATIVRFAKALCELHVSRVHPLMPLPLLFIAEFVLDHRFDHESFLLHLRELVVIFSQLKNVNDHEQSYLALLPRSCASTSSSLVNHTAEGSGAS